jgi:hypothetical protein
MIIVTRGEKNGWPGSNLPETRPKVHGLLGARRMTPAPAVSDTPGQEEKSNADLLQGLGALADLLGNACETLNRCLLTIEDTLRALPVVKDQWVPIRALCCLSESVAPEDEGQASQERVFGGVSVTIMKMGASTPQQSETQRCEWQYELGYSLNGEGRALMVRTCSFELSDEREGFSQFSDMFLLREAPLEIRLKAIREIPNLMKSLDLPGEPVQAVE